MRCACGHVVSCGCECIAGKCPACRTRKSKNFKVAKKNGNQGNKTIIRYN